MSLWRRLTGFERSDVLSPLTQDACIDRIRAAIGGPLGFLGQREVYGWRAGASFWLRWQTDVQVVQSLLFASVTRVTFEHQAAGVLVRFRSRPSVFSFLILALLVVIAAHVALFALMAILTAGPGVERILVVAAPFGLGLLYVILRVAQHLGLDEDPHFEVVKFVSRVIDGAPVVKDRRGGGIVE